MHHGAIYPNGAAGQETPIFTPAPRPARAAKPRFPAVPDRLRQPRDRRPLASCCENAAPRGLPTARMAASNCVTPIEQKGGDGLERRPLVGIARERETCANDAGPANVSGRTHISCGRGDQADPIMWFLPVGVDTAARQGRETPKCCEPAWRRRWWRSTAHPVRQESREGLDSLTRARFVQRRHVLGPVLHSDHGHTGTPPEHSIRFIRNRAIRPFPSGHGWM